MDGRQGHGLADETSSAPHALPVMDLSLGPGEKPVSTSFDITMSTQAGGKEGTVVRGG